MGQYSFPFSFKLSENMPGSFSHDFKLEGENCYAKTQYKLKAGLKDPTSRRSLFEKINFVVDQRWEMPAGPQTRSYSKKLSGSCYSDLGYFSMNCSFDKDKFIVGDQARLIVAVDNSSCESAVDHITCQLVQTTRIQTKDNRFNTSINKVVSEVKLAGLKEGTKRVGADATLLALPIKTDTEFEASCEGNLIKNEFRILISVEMADCLCMGENPHNEIPVKVFNRPLQYMPFQPQVPQWNPTVMNPYVCTIAQESRMTSDFRNQIYIATGVQYPSLGS